MGHIWNNLHATRNNTGGTTASGSVSRGGGATEALGQLLDKSAADIESSYVNGVSNAKYDQRTLRRQWQTLVGGIQPGARGFLDLANADTLLADN